MESGEERLQNHEERTTKRRAQTEQRANNHAQYRELRELREGHERTASK
jgi:hypothetical protein